MSNDGHSTENDAGRVNPYLRIEDTTWPSPLDPNETQWRLRYGQPNREDLLFAASVMSAYGYLFEMSQRDRNRRMGQIKSTLIPPEGGQHD